MNIISNEYFTFYDIRIIILLFLNFEWPCTLTSYKLFAIIWISISVLRIKNIIILKNEGNLKFLKYISYHFRTNCSIYCNDLLFHIFWYMYIHISYNIIRSSQKFMFFFMVSYILEYKYTTLLEHFCFLAYLYCLFIII